MTKQETITCLTNLMASVQNAYFKGRMENHPLPVHEREDENAISIDLYNFGGDGEPVCDGLRPCTLTYDDGSQEDGWLFCMCYNPDDVTPLFFLFDPDGRGDMEIDPEDVPEKALKDIFAWLDSEVSRKPLRPRNDVTSFFFYMWNAWCEEECKRAFGTDGGNWKHFWSKWCGIYNAYGVHGAAERFYAELSNGNRNLLVGRAIEAYEGDEPKNKNGKA